MHKKTTRSNSATNVIVTSRRYAANFEFRDLLISVSFRNAYNTFSKKYGNIVRNVTHCKANVEDVHQ